MSRVRLGHPGLGTRRAEPAVAAPGAESKTEQNKDFSDLTLLILRIRKKILLKS